jgi:hypothetical protein
MTASEPRYATTSQVIGAASSAASRTRGERCRKLDARAARDQRPADRGTVEVVVSS